MTKYHTVERRFWAGFVDSLVLFPLSMDIFTPAPDRRLAAAMAWTIVSWLITVAYSVLLHARYGQTLGKMITGVRVLDISEQRVPGVKQALLRDLGGIAINIVVVSHQLFLMATGRYGRTPPDAVGPMLVFIGIVWYGWYLLEVITTITNARRRAVHDYLAGTVVVRPDNPTFELSRLEG
jgi:uncharacterized RDD family membrane protein YckC